MFSKCCFKMSVVTLESDQDRGIFISSRKTIRSAIYSLSPKFKFLDSKQIHHITSSIQTFSFLTVIANKTTNPSGWLLKHLLHTRNFQFIFTCTEHCFTYGCALLVCSATFTDHRSLSSLYPWYTHAWKLLHAIPIPGFLRSFECCNFELVPV